MSIFKKIVALLSALIILFSFAACNNTTDPETTTVNETETALLTETTEESTEKSTEESTEEITTAVQTTEAEKTTTEKVETTTEKPTTTKAETTTQKPTTAKKVTTTKKAATTKKVTTTKAVTAPSSKADIVKLYNSAAATAASKKPGYKKSTNTVLSNLEMGALASISAVRETVGNFLGEGSTTVTVSKGSFDGKSFVKSTLKAEDVTSATCKLSGDKKYYELTITVKNEENPLKSSSALGRFTKDFKDINEIKMGLTEAGASVGSINVKTTKVTITAKIDVANNRFVSVTHNMKMAATLNNVKYLIAKVNKATANLETTVKYSDFKY